MELSELKKIVLESNAFSSFNPMQEKALPFLFEKNLVVSAPTASGKTLLAELASLNSIINQKQKVVYTAPLRALAFEHFHDFREKYSKKLNIRIAISTGDIDSSGRHLSNYDLIFTTFEKCFPFKEFIAVKIGNKLELIEIGKFFELVEKDSKKIVSGKKIDLIPNKEYCTISYSKKLGKPVFSKIKSVLKAENSEELAILKLDSGRTITTTFDHKIFSLENCELFPVPANDLFEKHVAALSNAKKIFHENVKKINLVEMFLNWSLADKFYVRTKNLCLEELTAVLTTDHRTMRRAKQLAKKYLKSKKIPLSVASRLKNCAIISICGLRKDTFHEIPAELVLSRKFGKFLGYFISEGSYAHNKKFGGHFLRFPAMDKDMELDIIELCKKLDFPFKHYSKNFEIRVCSKQLYYLFKQCFGIGKAAEKQIPDFSFFASKNFVRGLFEGLYAGDGGVDRNAIEYSTKNYKLALQISLLLLKFNIHTNIYPQKIKGYTDNYWRVVLLSAQNAKRFLGIVKDTKKQIIQKALEMSLYSSAREDLFENLPVRNFLTLPKYGSTLLEHSIYSQWHRNQRIPRQKLIDYANKKKFEKVKALAKQPISFLKVKKIVKISNCDFVYNIQTEEGNFFTANGILVKNCDSLQRHNADWLKSVGLLVVDEVHELDSNRGATLEMGISKFLFINPKIQLLALSATIPNAKELAEWLGAELVESDYRPIPLKEGIYFNGEINYGKDVEEIGFEKNELHSIAKNTFLKKKQALIFANTRKRAESIAFQLSELAESNLSESERKKLENDSEKILNVLELPTEQCKRLSEMVKHGTAFHHAGLLNAQRKIVEDLFKQNCLKLLSATPTLSAGVNLPSHTVVLSSCYRYGVNGMEPLAVREIKQMLGRAGRPKYDSEGRGVLIARNELETGELLENYINGEIESISSKLGIMPVLRMHLLSLISSNYVFDLKSCEKFFSKTFYAKQFDSLSELFGKISEILDELKEMNFLEEYGEKFKATVLGKRVSELYLDPLSAFEMINSLKKEMVFSEQSYLFLLTQSFEFSPWLSVSKKNEAGLWEALELEKKQLPCDIEREMFFDLNLLKKFNSSKALKDWINEILEETILENFNLQPGILHSKLEICDWLCYSALELSNLLELKKHFEPLAKLRKRLKHGIKEELIHLTELKGIGRVRGRKLYNAGIKSIADLKKTDALDLSKILGQKIAESVKKELGQAN